MVLGCPLALWIINTATPLLSCTLGQETPLMRTCRLPWQRGPSVRLKEPVLRHICRKINIHTRWQPQSGHGSKVKEPCFLSRQTRAALPSWLPLHYFFSFSLSPFFFIFLSCLFFIYWTAHRCIFFVCFECDWWPLVCRQPRPEPILVIIKHVAFSS